MISFQGLWASTSSSRWLVLCECMCMCMGLFYPQPENMPTRHSLHAPRTAFPFASTLLDSGRPTSPHSTESLLLHFPDLTSGKLCTKGWLIYQPVGTAPRVITVHVSLRREIMARSITCCWPFLVACPEQGTTRIVSARVRMLQ